MTDAELLDKVKTGLGVSGTYNNATLAGRVAAVRQYMLAAGVTPAQVETPLGIATLTVGVSDLWNLSPGEVRFSAAFSLYLLPQLQAVSIDV